jgi:tRNA A-37 threonylcarbamoyl transferase component Bud32/tetratricopeptide (TPR) repeat protein
MSDEEITQSDIVGDARPRPLDSADGRRVRDDIRARLFQLEAAVERIGRYTVLRKLGQGALGVVYACTDPRLDREIAVKVIRSGDTARLRREAMAMAMLSDPHVASVYEVGEHEGRVFLAMELVDGPTLREWQKGRTADEIVAAYVQAGRGLAAAHRAGLVHRDFKPDNAMIGRDGRVRVLDFGLACTDDTVATNAGEATVDAPSMDATLTTTGVTVGTPAYMAIEQLRGGAIDARADQYSFAVALYEALAGERPYHGRSPGELAEAIRRGKIEPSKDARAIAPTIAKVIERGLAADRDARFPDMDAMLAALVPRRRTWPLAIAGLAIVGTAATVWALSGRADPCEHAADALDGHRDPERADRIAAWRSEALAVCRGEGEDLELRRSCLDDTRAAIENGVDLSLAECLDLRRRGRAPTVVATEHMDAAARVRAAIAKGTDEGAQGNYAAALATVEPMIDMAREIGDHALLGDVLVLVSAIQSHRGDHAAAEALAVEAYEIGRAAGLDRLALRATATLVEIVGYSQRRRDDGEQWVRTAEAIAARLPQDDRAITDLLVNRALMRLEHGDRESARADLEQALARYEDDVAKLPVLSNLAHIASLEGDVDRSLELLGEEIAILERERGADHPDLVAALTNRSGVLVVGERFADAHADLDRAAKICAARDLASELPQVRRARGELAYEEGEFSAAHGHVELALEGFARLHGLDHPLVYSAKVLMARVRIEQGDIGGARTLLHDVVTAAEAEVGADTGVVGAALLELAKVELEAGDWDAAWKHLERARPLTSEDATASITWLSRSAQVLIGKGGPAMSIDGLEKVDRSRLHSVPLVVAELELTLAQAHAGAGHPRSEYEPLAIAARDKWRRRGWTRRADAVDAWLAAR